MTENNNNTIPVYINEDLYNRAESKLDNIDEYLEQQLIILLEDDFTDEYEILIELSDKVSEIRELESELLKIRENRVTSIDKTIFNESMSTITRIHDNIGMIGRNQIKSIAKRNGLPYDALLREVKGRGFEVVNYTGVNK